MKYRQQSYTTHYYNAINEIPEEVWKDLECVKNQYFHPDFLNSLEKNNTHLKFFYIVLRDEFNNAIAFASLQVIDFYIDDIQHNSKSIIKTIISLGRKLKVLPREKPLRILNCGNTFVSGEHGIFIKENQNKRALLRKLAEATHIYTQDYYNENPVDIFIVKDFLEDFLPISNELISLGYYAFNVEPNMKFSLNTNWSNFDDYLASLRTKFRVKAKRAAQLSRDLIVKEITCNNIDNQLKKMTSLYKKVASKASFNLGEFNLSTYKDLKEKLNDSYILKSYWLINKMVGYMSGIINGKNLDAHFVGIDYSLNKQYAVYQKMLYDYINIAIENNIETLNFGRTASEIKSSVGAVPEHLTIYIRHKKSITNKFLKLFLLKIQPTEFNQKFPFKLEEDPQ